MTDEVARGQVAELACELDQALWDLRERMGRVGVRMSWHLTIEMGGTSPEEKLCQEAPGANETGV